MLRLGFKTKRSAGVRVTKAVFKLIAAGNAARDSGDWLAARDAYHQALVIDPKLHHIRIQLGHALKHLGQLREADVAYAVVAQACPDQMEPLKCRAYLAKDTGRVIDAIGYFKQALSTGLRDEAAAEISCMIGASAPLSPAVLSEILAEKSAAPAPTPLLPAGHVVEGPAPGRPVLYDLTDLVGHFQGQRMPNGIERVQIELALAALHSLGTDRVQLCCFVNSREEWVEVPAGGFHSIARLATVGSDIADADWQNARAGLVLHLIYAAPLVPRSGAILINAGTSWRVHDYFRFVRDAKSRYGIRYVPFVHDLIPLVAAQYCVPGITEDFTSWLIGAVRHADGFLVNSRATRDDLLRVAAQLGSPIAEAQVEVIPLDADFVRPAEPVLQALSAWGLTAGPFALMVSTIEPRKNHLLALDAWAQLLERHGGAVPPLVCVGRKGWRCDEVLARVDETPVLKAHVRWIHDASDAQLAALYEGCAFSLYPSLYEGWGLPVTEALAYGRVPVIADNSSLPEAGAGLALLFRSGSVTDLVGALERVMFDQGWRQEREREIRERFAPRSWAALSDQVLAAIARIAKAAEEPVHPPVALLDRYYPLRLQRQRHVWPGLGSGEIFREGDGWFWPEADRCRIRPGCARLRLRITHRSTRPLQLRLHVQGLAQVDCLVTVRIGGVASEAMVPAGVTTWLSCAIEGPEEDIAVQIEAQASEPVTVAVCGMDKSGLAAISVLGFLLDDGIDALVAKLFNADAPTLLLQRLDAYRNPRAVVPID